MGDVDVAGRPLHPFFSIVLPVHNGRRFLRDALDSVSAQSLRSWEAVVVDDGSDDNSMKVARQWARTQRRPVTILERSPSPGGGNVAGARNRGIAAASGRWVAFLDQDDYWRPEKLAEQRRFIVQHGGVSAVGCWPDVVFEQGPRLPFVEQWAILIRAISERESGLLPLRHFVVGCLLCMSGVVARRTALLAHGGFRPAFTWTSDWLMWAQLAADYPVGVVQAPLVTYRMHGRNELRKLLHQGPLGDRALAEIHAGLVEWMVGERGLTRDEATSTLAYLYGAAAPMWADATQGHDRIGGGSRKDT